MNIRPCVWLIAGLTGVWTLADAASALGQRVPGGRKVAPAQEMKLPTLTVDGVVDAVAPTALRVKSDAGQTWVLHLQPSTKVLLTGTAKADVLAPGGPLSCISFVAEVDTRRSRVEAKVSKLSIFTPNTKREVGAVPSQGFGASGLDGPGGAAKTPAGKAADGAKPDVVKPPRNDAPLFSDGGLGDFGKAKSGSRKVAGPAVRSLEVSGQIVSLKNGKISLHVPNQYFRSPLKFELAESPEISVELIDVSALRLVRPGDRVKAVCGQMSETMAKVNDIEVVMAAPLGGATAKKKPAAKSHKTDGDDAPAGKKDDATDDKKDKKDDASASSDDKSSEKSPEDKPVRKGKPRPKPAAKPADDDAPAEKKDQ